MKKIILASPRGFCAGVKRALNIVEEALKKYSSPVYVYHDIVHNIHVVENLRQKGVIFVENLRDVPKGNVVIFSAHGVSRNVENEAENRQLKVIDATCPLVKKIHHKAVKLISQGCSIILIGHRSHPEIIGTMGQIDNQALVVETVADVEKLPFDKLSKKVYYITQTTFGLDDVKDILNALKHRIPQLKGTDDICYATSNRQQAVRLLAERSDVVLVIGSSHSSNSCRLCETAKQAGKKAFLLNDISELSSEMTAGSDVVGITAGASAPEYLVEELLNYFKEQEAVEVAELFCETERCESVVFKN